MSYILDALRKADAERERDPARGIHAQPVNAAPPATVPLWKRPGVIALALAVVALAAGVATWRPAAQPAAPVTPATPVITSPPVPAPAAPAPAAAVMPPPPPMPVPAPVAAPAPAPAAAPADRILSVAEAPPEVQKLAVSGGVYSENVAQRMLIVGGQVFNEGSEVAPGIVLEQVRPKSAVLKYRGQRFAVPF